MVPDLLKPPRLEGAYAGEPVPPAARPPSRLLDVLLPAAVGVFIGLGAIAGTGLAPKETVKVLGTLLLIMAAVLSGRPKPVLLFAWVASLTYNRNYFLDFLGNHGSEGLYWNPSDLFLVALLVLWLVQLRRSPVESGAKGPSTYLIFLPFFGAAVLSGLDAVNPVWSIFELARLARILVILLYVQYNVGKEDLWVVLAGVGAAILLQSAQGLVYLATGKELGLAFFLGAGEGAEAYGALMEGATPLAFRRAQGTLGHPNTLAIYLLLTTPLFLALALARSAFRARWLAGLVALAGIAGLVATLSRTGWVLILGQMILLTGLLLAFRFMDVRRALGIGLAGGFFTLLLLLPFANQIHQRLTGDLSESLEFRVKHNALAMEIWRESPLTGVGLNNYSRRLGQEDVYEVEVMEELGEHVRTGLQLRVLAWVHNIYLLILAETGLVGLVGFLFFLGGAAWMAFRAILETTGVWRVMALGVGVGMMGVHLHGVQESALWIDPVTYTFALMVGVVGNLRAMGSSEDVAPTGSSLRSVALAGVAE